MATKNKLSGFKLRNVSGSKEFYNYDDHIILMLKM